MAALSLTQHHRQQQPLTAVALVCASRDGLAALASHISAFIDPARSRHWTIERVCERGYLRLLQHLVNAGRDAHKPALYRAHVFSRALAYAVAHDNDLALFACLRAYCPSGSTSLGMETAARLGKLHVMQNLATHCESGLIWSSRFTQAAAGAGHLAVVQWLATKSAPHPDRICSAATAAIAGDHLAITKWLLESADHNTGEALGVAQQSALLAAACSAGSLEIVRYLLEDRGYRPPTAHWCMTKVVASGNLELVQWLYAQGHHSLSSVHIRTAMESGCVEVVRWMVKNDLVRSVASMYHLKQAAEVAGREIAQMLYDVEPALFSPKLLAQKFQSAAQAGDVTFVQWLFTVLQAIGGWPASTHASDAYGAIVDAASSGHVEVVQWIFTHLRELTPAYDVALMEQIAVSEATGNGHSDIAKWLHASRMGDTPAGLNTAVRAAKTSRQELIKWTLQSTEWVDATTSLLMSAVTSGDMATLQWLHAHIGFDPAYWGARVLAAAVRNNHVHIVEWLHAHGYEDGWCAALMDNATSLEMVEWLHVHHAESGCTTVAMDYAAARGDFDTLLFLHAHRHEGCSASAAVCALANGHTHIVEWLLDTYPNISTVEGVMTETDYAARH